MSSTIEKPREIFISYGSADKAVAEEICAGLESNGLRCWIAPRNIDAGSTWTGSILKAITQCRIMALIFSTQSNESEHVQREILHAVEQKCQIFPIRIEPVKPTGGLAYCLVGVQWFDATAGPMSQYIAPLTTQLRLLLQRSGDSTSVETAPDIYFQCATCQQHLVTEATAAGQTGQCPNCGTPFTVPEAGLAAGPSNPDAAAGVRGLSGTQNPPAVSPARSSNPAPPHFDGETIAEIKATLATFLGPLAKVLVDRAVPKAGNLTELLHLLAAELDSPADQARFTQAVMSARSGGRRGK